MTFMVYSCWNMCGALRKVPSDPSWDVVQSRAMMFSERKINDADLMPSTSAYTAPLKNGSPELVFLKIVKDYNFDL